MANSQFTAHPRRRRWSLAGRLSLLFVALLVLVITAFGAAAYQGVRDAATQSAAKRLISVARDLASSSTRSSVIRTSVLQQLANDLVIQRAVAAQAPEGGADRTTREVPAGAGRTTTVLPAGLDSLVTARLMLHYPATDSGMLGSQLWDVRGNRRHGPVVHGPDSTMLDSTMARTLRTDSVVRSPLFTVGQQIRFWTAHPVRVGRELTGVIAEQRRITGSAQTEGLIARLTGQDAKVLIGSRQSTVWASTLGIPEQPPIGTEAIAALPDTATLLVHRSSEGPVYVAVAPVAGTPWRVALVQPESSILARPREILNELLLIGLILLGVGTVGAWWLSRLETRPLGALREAADAMAAGDYSQVVSPEGAEETAALAEAFNTMSLRISGVHATLAQQNEALLRANEAKARFLAVMSHELRTPLNSIGGHAELVALGVHGPVTGAQLDALQRIGRSKDQLVALVSDILHYARLEAMPLQVTRQNVRVQRVLDSVRETVADQFRRKGVTLTTTPTDAVVTADPVRVQQVMINLVTNALQFTKSGGAVDVSAQSGDGWTTLRVRDTGVGISPLQQVSIFEPFVQADNSLTRRSGGAGLGLAIVRQLVTAMGGLVSVESEVGVGSTFSVALPDAVLPETVAAPVVDDVPAVTRV